MNTWHGQHTGASTRFEFWQHKVVTRSRNRKIALTAKSLPHHGLRWRIPLIFCSKTLNFRDCFAWKTKKTIKTVFLKNLSYYMYFRNFEFGCRYHNTQECFALWNLPVLAHNINILKKKFCGANELFPKLR